MTDMAIDKLNSLQFLFLRANYFQEFGDLDGVYVDRLPYELRRGLLRWTWPTTARNHYFFQHEGRYVITREGWEAFVRWVCLAMDRQLGAEEEAMGQFRPADATSQRFASVWDAIEDDPAEAEKMKRWSALRMRADAMATLLCVQPVGREAMADEVQQWIDWWQPSYEAAQRLSADEIAALKTGGWWPPAADRQVAEMPPPVAQRQVPSDYPAILHALYTLADYPVLAALAAERTEAIRLDGRACRALYEDARQRIDWQAMPPHEREFAQRLGVGP